MSDVSIYMLKKFRIYRKIVVISSCMHAIYITAKDIACEGEMVKNFPLHQLSP